jgi:hypothetical protein
MIYASCCRQSDSGEGWVVSQNGTRVTDAVQRSQIAREIATDLPIKEGCRFGISIKHCTLKGWVLPDNKDNFGRFSTAIFLVRHEKGDSSSAICDALMSNLRSIEVILSEELQSSLLSEVKTSLKKKPLPMIILLAFAITAMVLIAIGILFK